MIYSFKLRARIKGLQKLHLRTQTYQRRDSTVRNEREQEDDHVMHVVLVVVEERPEDDAHHHRGEVWEGCECVQLVARPTHVPMCRVL